MKSPIRYIHRIAAVIALLITLSFFISSLVELLGDKEAILEVKTYIFYLVWLLIPLMMLTGLSGFKMAPKVNKGPIASKSKRMPFIALNGLFILLPFTCNISPVQGTSVTYSTRCNLWS